MNSTCVHTGCVSTRAIHTNVALHVLGAFDQFLQQRPYAVTGIDCDNRSEFINHNLVGCAGADDTEHVIFADVGSVPHILPPGNGGSPLWGV